MRSNPKHLCNPFYGLMTFYPSCSLKYCRFMLSPEMNERSKITYNTQGPIVFRQLLVNPDTHTRKTLGTTFLPTRKVKIASKFNSLAASCIRATQYFGLISNVFGVLHMLLDHPLLINLIDIPG